MDYLLSFLEGIITFISPCLLPMLPIYITYFTGQNNEGEKQTAITNALGFVLGFTLVFVSLGAISGQIGGFLVEHRTTVNLVSGLILILFGLNFLELIRLPFINNPHQFLPFKTANLKFFSALVFGIVFSISWTPCVGTFLGAALLLAATSGGSGKGIILLLCFSAGLGIPFVVSAVLIERFKATFDIIKRNYRIINLISGSLLIIVGISIASGWWGNFLAQLTF